MRYHLVNTVKKLALLSGISGISYYFGRNSIENDLKSVSYEIKFL